MQQLSWEGFLSTSYLGFGLGTEIRLVTGQLTHSERAGKPVRAEVVVKCVHQPCTLANWLD